ncbi:hypothetical protein [Bacillus thuringiensis]|uniref:Uncharacterized protein n=1 Tax=Bacillus thuringiensis Bt18247 TaxID=1423143 RepID=A0A9W3X737_BACTU|nr:hypothetical protein [Bacillus thuringiensis]AOM09289.1 hypothetical protein BTI247_08550 [Bacillus thuringiensis Bt18247]MBG9526545.1 hypothetical protein [Bacillus thuringiensis]
MLWFLVYMIIGMVYVSVQMRSILQKVLKEGEGDEKGEVITIAVALLIICLLASLWPACMTFRAIKLCSKDGGTSAK